MKKGLITIYLLIFIGILFLAAACSFKKKDIHSSNFHRIVIATGGCYGTCPFSAIEMDSSLAYKFYGGEYSSKTGYYKGYISQELWDSLIVRLERINYKLLDTCYCHSVDDLSMELYLFYDGKCKHIIAQSASLPDSVYNCFSWILKTQNRAHLLSCKDSLRFITSIQKGIPPPPLKTKIKFVPPEVKEN